MPTLVLDPALPPFQEMLEQRKRAGLDRFDEVWEGVLHLVPAPTHEHGRLEWQLPRLLGPAADAAGLEMTGEVNIGESGNDFRVPDGALHRPGAAGIWHATAALVIEIVSPGDESWQKLPFYAQHRVDEVLIVDPAARNVHWLGLTDEGTYGELERSGLIGIGSAELAGLIDWP